MFHNTPFQIIKIYSLMGLNRAMESLWHKLSPGWCESDIYSVNIIKIC